MATTEVRLEKKYVEVAPGVSLAVVDEGCGDPVLMLHGFPDSSYLWRHQIAALVDAGYRVIAPDLRGFGDSSKPYPIRDYNMKFLLADIVALFRQLGVSRAHIVGHDWGAAIAWLVASLVPARTDHLCVMSVAHPSLHHTPTLEQRIREWYMLLFQFEDVAEALLQHDDWALFREMSGDEKDFEHWIYELSKPGGLRGALNIYRANRRPTANFGPPPQLPRVLAPTLGIASSGDPVCTPPAMLASEPYVGGPWEYVLVEGAGHWIPVDQPDQVNEHLLGFLGRYSGVDGRAPTRKKRGY